MTDASNKSLPFTPIDYIFTGEGAYPVEFIFFFDYLIDNNKLKAALQEALRFFYPLQSKLVKLSAQDYQMETAADGFVYEYREALADKFSEDPCMYLNPIKAMENEPLGTMTLTRTAEGSALGISFAHFIADGFSSFYFMTELAKLFTGKRILEPEIKRDWFKEAAAPFRKTITPADLIALTGFSGPFPRKDHPRSNVVWGELIITNDEIDSLLQTARQGINEKLSKNDVLAAYLWKTCMTRWHEETMPEKTYVTMPLDIRRYSSWVAGNYFGNGICLITGEMEYEKFCRAGLSELAQFIRLTVNKTNQEYAVNSYNILQQFRRQEGLAKMQELYVAHPESGILVTNLSRVPLENINFGQGRPVRFMTVSTSPRAAIILPHPNGLRVDICHPIKE